MASVLSLPHSGQKLTASEKKDLVSYLRAL
jgi:hypothetical protein